MEIDLDIDLDPNRPLDLVFYFDLYRVPTGTRARRRGVGLSGRPR